MSNSIVYLNGRLVPQAEARLTLHDAGFVFGATVTDLCRTFRHRLFRLADHLARFRESCRRAEVPQPLSDMELAALAERLVAHNAALLPPEQDLALVLFATPGPIGYYLGEPGGPGDGSPTLGMHTFPLPLHRYARLFREGARLVVPSVRHVPADCVDPTIKQRSRLHWWLAEREASRIEPGASALLLDADGHVTETAAANFLLVKDGTLISPPGGGVGGQMAPPAPPASVLGGISRQVVAELAAAMGIPFVERSLDLDRCRQADEALLTSTSFCVAGVRSINGFALPWPGPVFERLLAAWSERVGLDIRRQILPDR